MNFSNWLNEAKKSASVAHTDIDRWLKSVDGLAKDLNALKDAKAKAKGKMDQIGNKSKPKPDEDKVIDPNQPEDRKILSLRSKPDEKEPEPKESNSKPVRQFRRPDAEDSTDVKRVIEDRPNPKRPNPKRPNPKRPSIEKDVE